MRAKKPPALHKAAILIEMACHTMMGVALGLVFSFTLLLIDAFGITTLIAHGADTRTVTTIFVGTFTLAFAVGATLTGFVFTMMEER